MKKPFEFREICGWVNKDKKYLQQNNCYKKRQISFLDCLFCMKYITTFMYSHGNIRLFWVFLQGPLSHKLIVWASRIAKSVLLIRCKIQCMPDFQKCMRVSLLKIPFKILGDNSLTKIFEAFEFPHIFLSSTLTFQQGLLKVWRMCSLVWKLFL